MLRMDFFSALIFRFKKEMRTGTYLQRPDVFHPAGSIVRMVFVWLFRAVVF
jgi:hypothetical protein